jgi:hypothetical protein
MIETLARQSEQRTWIARAVTENSIVRVRGLVGRLTNVKRKTLRLVCNTETGDGLNVAKDERVEVIRWSGELADEWLKAHTDGQGQLKDEELAAILTKNDAPAGGINNDNV